MGLFKVAALYHFCHLDALEERQQSSTLARGRFLEAGPYNPKKLTERDAHRQRRRITKEPMGSLVQMDSEW